MSVSIYNDVVTQMPDVTDEEVDLKLEEAVIQSEKAAYSSHRERRIQSKLNSESGEAERSSKR